MMDALRVETRRLEDEEVVVLLGRIVAMEIKMY